MVTRARAPASSACRPAASPPTSSPTPRRPGARSPAPVIATPTSSRRPRRSWSRSATASSGSCRRRTLTCGTVPAGSRPECARAVPGSGLPRHRRRPGDRSRHRGRAGGRGRGVGVAARSADSARTSRPRCGRRGRGLAVQLDVTDGCMRAAAERVAARWAPGGRRQRRGHLARPAPRGAARCRRLGARSSTST